MRPRHPIRVLVQGATTGAGVDTGLMREWRWTDERISAWEGLVSLGGVETWIAGSQLTRLGISESVDPPVLAR